MRLPDLAAQVMDAAMEAGAEDVQTDEGEGGEVEGFKVLKPYLQELYADLCSVSSA